ncbi:RNA polymerase sigma factor [Sorangium sp. KYC3313]|uniref:RNA polymerase sigma factor n=1 Tax=Sorangium sp. KYC3313 TaxID=3449740 RepID=UPI003F8C0DE8
MSLDDSPELLVEELIGRARAGDPSAFTELFRQCGPMLEKWAARRLKDARSSAIRPSDLAQETALRAFQKFSTFTGATEAEWLSWLRAVLRNYTLQVLRDAKREKRKNRGTVVLDCIEAMDVPSPQRSPSQAMAREEQRTETWALIYELPEDQRDAIYLCHLRELPVAEVARIMRRTEPAVAGLLRRGLKALQSRMISGKEACPGDDASAASSADAAAALLIYLQRRDAGERVDPQAFLAENPSCADELRPMLDWIERIRSMRPASLSSKR